MGSSVFTSPSDSRALIGSSSGLAERDMSNCGTLSFSPSRGVVESGEFPPSTSESRLRGSFCLNPSSFPTRSILLKYCGVLVGYRWKTSPLTLTVLTCNSSVASSSTTIIGCACNCRLDSVHMWFTPPSMHLCNARALCAPVMMMTTSRACCSSATAATRKRSQLTSNTVCTPTVSAILGT